MRLIWRLLKFWRAPAGGLVVQTHDQLQAAIGKAPRRIVVEGDEALRAYAARLADDSESEAFQTAFAESGAATDYPAAPVVGRIKDMRDRKSLPNGMSMTIWRVERRVRGRLVLSRERRTAV